MAGRKKAFLFLPYIFLYLSTRSVIARYARRPVGYSSGHMPYLPIKYWLGLGYIS